MPTSREIRRRIKSVRSTAQITRAMEMVAASKMKRAQAMALAARPYEQKMYQVLSHLAAIVAKSGGAEAPHQLLQRREKQAVGLVLVTPDGGLAGGMTTALLQKAGAFVLAQDCPVKVIASGRKGKEWVVRRGLTLVNEFSGLGNKPDLMDTFGISHSVIDGYLEGLYDEVHIGYTDFVNTMVQKPVLRPLLPVEPEAATETFIDYLYEPSPEAVLNELLPRFIEMEVYHAVLESIASEQSARMVAMRNATENAYEMIDQLTLTYNRIRQATITREIAEIAAAEAVLK